MRYLPLPRGTLQEKEKKGGGKAIFVRVMFVHRFTMRATPPRFVTLCFYHRPILTSLRVLPTIACDMTASMRCFVSMGPIASVATAISRASKKSKPQPQAPAAAGGPPTNNGRQPCNRTQEKLDELLQKNNGTPKYSLNFFNVTHKKGDWKSCESQHTDKLERCCVDCAIYLKPQKGALNSRFLRTLIVAALVVMGSTRKCMM